MDTSSKIRISHRTPSSYCTQPGFLVV